MENKLILPDEIILNKIFIIRNQKVMLDKDIAEIFDVKPKRLREQVKRNVFKFPDHFMFQLTEKEALTMASQNAIPPLKYFGGTMPYVFTEYGILQLSNILRSDKATQMSIRIIEVFIKMREILLNNKEINLKIEEIMKQLNVHEDRMDMLYKYLSEFIDTKKNDRKELGYKATR